ncbi:MAG: ABC transporter ATP-binding protein [Thiobacillus sp.]|nr:ABC transporter ATP-binding protein [Thiobacillus sp.]
MDAIAVDGLDVVYAGGHKAVDGLSLSVRRGEIFGLLGANGAGKTSLIKILATLLRPSAGRVRVLGRDPAAGADAIKRRLGVVPQDNNLDVDLDVRGNLHFHCRYFGLARSEYRPAVERWLATLGLADKAGAEVMHLSGGSKRKVMLAKAFLTGPELLVLDEPTTGLDPEIRAVLWRHIRDFRAQGGTVFLSTHHMEEAERLCDRVAVMRRGRLIACDTPRALAAAHGQESLEETFQHLAARETGS